MSRESEAIRMAAPRLCSMLVVAPVFVLAFAGCNGDDPECSNDSECAPGVCRDGVCSDAPSACGSDCSVAPAAECQENDSVFVTFSAPGTCNEQSEQCEFEEQRVPCEDCGATCLVGDCSGLSCSDLACEVDGVGELVDGACQCVYEPRADGDRCVGQPGRCTGGSCGCAVDADCDDNDPCTAESCVDAQCSQTETPSAEGCTLQCPTENQFSAANFDGGERLVICADVSSLTGDVELTADGIRLTGSVGPIGVLRSESSGSVYEAWAGYLLDFFE